MHLFFQIYFCNETLHVLNSSSVHHQGFLTVHTATVYVIQVFWQLAIRIGMELALTDFLTAYKTTGTPNPICNVLLPTHEGCNQLSAMNSIFFLWFLKVLSQLLFQIRLNLLRHIRFSEPFTLPQLAYREYCE